MRILPAVDIRGGRCVNLVQGDYQQETVFAEDPVAQAVEWRRRGGALVHIVDLDGAVEGRLCAQEALYAIAAEGVPFEVGGGIRSMEGVEQVIHTGAARVILGTAAYRNPALLREAARAYPDRVAVGIDARDGQVALSGWKDITETGAVEFARTVEAAGAARIIYTDILSDGMMEGPNLEATRAVAEAVTIPVTASGGISSLADVRDLRELEPAGVDEVIIGRALYLGAFTVEEAVEVAGGAAS
jgi:phosphoribosylformimino-5-aminoimidazole carboxamide ribotide isomerase